MEKKKILFADDDPEIREALRLLLNCEGYDTVEASCGEEVLEVPNWRQIEAKMEQKILANS